MFFLNMIQLNLFINKNIVNFILLLYKLMRCFMRKRLLIVFSVLLFLLCLSVVSATDENTNSSIVAQDYGGNEFYVDLGGDDSNSGQLNSPFNSINKAVEVSKSNDNVVIHLGEGTFEGNGNVMISINKAHLSQGGSITIVGAGADKTIIKGSSAYYAFNIYADSVVTLRDLSIVDCKSVEGGAICNSGTLLVDNCIFRNNFAFNTGGAISSIENGDCKIYNSVFINNSVICNDEYENANGGAVYSLKSDLLVDSCRFVGNFAKGNCLNAISGGAIYVGAYLNNVPSVKNSNFINNYVVSTSFRTNWQYAKGGSIYMINCNLFNDSFINSSVTGNNGVGGSYYSEPKYLNSISNILRINSSVNGVLESNIYPADYILTAYNPVNGEQKGVTITVKSLIVQNDLTKYYLNASRFQATIYNKDGSLAVNKNVTFNINGVFYTRTTDSNGVVSLAINLRPGDYIITTIFDGLDIGNKVTVLPTLVTKDLNMKYMDGSNFTAQTLDSQGKALANQTVSFNVNGVFYHRITNEDGIASLRIRLMAGEYIITSYWNNFQTGNTIKISP